MTGFSLPENYTDNPEKLVSRDESGRKRSGKYPNYFRFHIFMRERVRKRECSVGKMKSVTREIEIETIRSEPCR